MSVRKHLDKLKSFQTILCKKEDKELNVRKIIEN